MSYNLDDNNASKEASMNVLLNPLSKQQYTMEEAVNIFNQLKESDNKRIGVQK